MARLTPEEFDRRYGPYVPTVSILKHCNPQDAIFGDRWMKKYGKCLEDGTFMKPIPEKPQEKPKQAEASDAKKPR